MPFRLRSRTTIVSLVTIMYPVACVDDWNDYASALYDLYSRVDTLGKVRVIHPLAEFIRYGTGECYRS